MSRFFVPREAVRGNNITISGKEAHHILDVMRLKELDRVVAFDGTGREYVGFIREAKEKFLSVEIVETRTPLGRERSAITLIQAIPKKDKMDYIIEKASELGVGSVIPVITKRTIPKWDEKKSARNVERWQKIAKEASKQCGAVTVPEIGIVRSFSDSLKDSSDYDLAIMAVLNDEAIRLRDALSGFKGGKIAIAVGPEGDFTTDEV
ncbi:MAG: 16S rRNA (uracil(1498)-N(3))-methyltransferase, partial [Candidatus Omnitrophica bacterium]|nr:16S rRNA (uracil(1498)-N(3))-methyltransferase [Candidatus Omnitrophota bacterium]